jgi:hypothetical protein
MKMAISDNVIKVKRLILRDMSMGTNVFIQQVQDKAVAAILHGFDPEPESGTHPNPCEVYMRLFMETPEQLERLMGRDGTTGPGHEGRDRARAYLMGAGPCGPDTVTNFEKTVTLELD